MAGAGETTTETMAGEGARGAPPLKKMLPRTEDPLLIRTNFADQGAWEAIVKTITTTTSEGFKAYVEFLDDPEFQGLTAEQVLDLVSEYSSQHSFFMVADHVTITEPEHPIVIVNLDKDEVDENEEPIEPQYGRQFRAVPGAIQAIQNNLSVSNMGFEDFADGVDEDGVFRGFKE